MDVSFILEFNIFDASYSVNILFEDSSILVLNIFDASYSANIFGSLSIFDNIFELIFDDDNPKLFI